MKEAPKLALEGGLCGESPAVWVALTLHLPTSLGLCGCDPNCMLVADWALLPGWSLGLDDWLTNSCRIIF